MENESVTKCNGLEQGASMEPENRPQLMTEMSHEQLQYSCFRLQCEVSKLSTRIDEIQLAETKAVEELARVRELLGEYRNFSWHSSCNEHSLEGDRRCLTCIKTDALLAPKPLDTNEGGE